jgi:serine/threonine protein kinase
MKTDVEKRLNEFRKVRKIGEGTYGEVYEAIDTINNRKVAMKKMRIENKDEGIPITALREMCILKHLRHNNVVQLYEIIQDVDKIVLIFEYADMDLKMYVDKEKGIKDIKIIQQFTLQILKGLYYCNINRIIHRDLKPQNLLLISSEMTLKLCDFGLSRMFSLPMGKMTHEIITLWYRPPEVLLGIENYTTKVDSWSIGCIMAEMITGKPLFPGDCEIGQLFKIFQIMGTPNEDTWPGIYKLKDFSLNFPQWKPKKLKDLFPNFDKDGLDLMEKFLQMDPDKRITIKDAINHPFLEKVRDEEGDFD